MRLAVLVGVIGAIATVGSAGANDEIPRAIEPSPVALVGGDIYPVEGPVVENATLLFSRGKIVAVGRDVAIPRSARVLNVAGKRIYPGLIACVTHLGLSEIDSIRATRDFAETGELNPSVRAEVAVNPDSELLPVARANGLALAMTHPSGGLVAGTSALIRLDGWTYEQMVAEAPLGLHLNWPYARPSGERSDRDTRLLDIERLFAEGRAYARSRPPGVVPAGVAPDLRLEAMRPFVSGERPVLIHADAERQILAAVAWARTEGVRAVIVGGRDAPLVAELLASQAIAVIFGPLHELPARRDHAYDVIFRACARLHEKKVSFAIGAFDTGNARNLPYQAATAAAFGLPPEEALKAITIYPARILGVADRYGSLAAGKSATLMVTTGDPLEITNQVELLWIDGRPVDLQSRHTRLYQKYRERLEQESTQEF